MPRLRKAHPLGTLREQQPFLELHRVHRDPYGMAAFLLRVALFPFSLYGCAPACARAEIL
jgi:hypothetical protein